MTDKLRAALRMVRDHYRDVPNYKRDGATVYFAEDDLVDIDAALAAPVPALDDAALREILAVELNKFDFDGKLAVEHGLLPEYKVTFQASLIKAALAAMAHVRDTAANKTNPSPQISNEAVDDACEAFWAYGGGLWIKGRMMEPHLSDDIRKNFLAMRAALEAAMKVMRKP